MTPEQIAAMAVDREIGTPGPWTMSAVHRPPIGRGPHETDSNGNIFWGYSICGSNEHGGHIYPTLAVVHNFPESLHSNARRIARVPDMESTIMRLTAAHSDQDALYHAAKAAGDKEGAAMHGYAAAVLAEILKAGV